ncbi:MAG TPA: DUF167 family protein [Candidatus Sumerlaeota bacterium]|nr:DUF167 family protein [Candidatus Sumerlaeota bacterium]HPS00746.1 DUF167 family protein [Candidatus Sumerlaeota bacterium]
MSQEAVRIVPGGVEVRTHAQPNASKSEFAGLHGDRIKVRLQAKPVEGEANAALILFLAHTAGVAKSNVELLRGATSRQKDLRIVCADPESVLQRLIEAAGLPRQVT